MELTLNALLLYFAAVSAVLFVLMGVDKARARRHGWRLRERTLVLLAALGGALGGCLGMLLFRHKTLHPLFRWSFPLLLTAHLAAVLLLWELGALR